MIEPPDYPEAPVYQPRIKLPKRLGELVGLIALSEATQMYNNPYKFYPEEPRNYGKSWERIWMRLNAYKALYELGMIGCSEAGYQLTADGRYYVRQNQEYNQREEKRLTRQFEREKQEYYRNSHIDVW